MIIRRITRLPVALVGRLVRLHLKCALRVYGPEYVLSRLDRFATWLGYQHVLRSLGATIGEKCHIEAVVIQNAREGRCDNLRIGNHVYMGAKILFDLAASVTIKDDAAVGSYSCFVTHFDVGDRPLKNRFPRQEGSIVVGKGSFVGDGAMILHGVTIGDYALVGAMSLVNRDLPANAVAYGVPCRVARQYEGDPEADGHCETDR